MQLLRCALVLAATQGALALRAPPPRDTDLDIARTRKTIWINGYGRSLTSTVLAALETAPHTEFALFEPCHPLDKTGYRGAFVQCMKNVLNCNFANISYLFAWDKPLSRHGDANFSAEAAKHECESSGTRLFKTITPELITDIGRYVFPILDEHPNLYMVTIDRDPRAIYSSEKVTFGSKNLFNSFDVPGLCGAMERNLNTSHPRLIRINFDEAVSHPAKVFKGLFQKVGLPFGEDAQFFIVENFNNLFCHQTSYGTCRKNSTRHAQKWRKRLSAAEIQRFAEAPACQKVINHFGYDKHASTSDVHH